jgi:hypothetical protein
LTDNTSNFYFLIIQKNSSGDNEQGTLIVQRALDGQKNSCCQERHIRFSAMLIMYSLGTRRSISNRDFQKASRHEAATAEHSGVGVDRGEFAEHGDGCGTETVSKHHHTVESASAPVILISHFLVFIST